MADRVTIALPKRADGTWMSLRIVQEADGAFLEFSHDGKLRVKGLEGQITPVTVPPLSPPPTFPEPCGGR